MGGLSDSRGRPQSCDRLNGHGNAIAQVYAIMPLRISRTNTQIRWGKKISALWSIGRNVAGGTAVDYATLEALIAEGFGSLFSLPSSVAVRPHRRAARYRWHEVGGSQIDPPVLISLFPQAIKPPRLH